MNKLALAPWHKRFAWAGPYALLLEFSLIAILFMGLVRLFLVIWQHDRVAEANFIPEIFLYGLRVDLIQTGLFLLVPLLLYPLFAHQRLLSAWKWFVLLWTTLAILIMVLLEVSTPTFISQYDSRPNRLFIEYLVFPKEVSTMLWNGFRGVVIGATLVLILLTWSYYKFAQPWLKSHLVNHQENWSWKRKLIVWPLALIVTLFAIRSSTQHRPANPAMFALTADAMVNSLTINSTWSIIHAIYNLKYEDKTSEAYGSLPKADIVNIVRNSPWLADKTFPYEKFPTVHYQKASVIREKPLNIVILLQESLGATFVESLGGIPVTPNLERFKNEGWWFEHLFATGTRSVRGIEAVVAGFPPTPALSVVKLSLSQTGFYTIADQLARAGYHTQFMYGGEAHFDNMRSFFTGNGFTHIVDQSSYVNPTFVGTWGVSDEDLFTRADEEIQQLHDKGQPFFKLVFSSSNHTPWEYPSGKIEPYEQPATTRNNTVKYADYALGKFIDTAKTRNYWKDTLFLIVADHDDRVYGDALVPVHKFHIPGLILGADITPKRITDVASQIDLAPTLLSLAGISGETALFGRDLTQADDAYEGRAMMQFNDYFAWLEGDALTILSPDKPALKATYNFTDKEVTFSQEAPSKEEAEKALAHSLLPSLLYRERSYYVPMKKKE